MVGGAPRRRDEGAVVLAEVLDGRPQGAEHPRDAQDGVRVGGAACVALGGGAGDGGDVVRERLDDELVGEDGAEDLDVGAGVGDEERGAAA